MGIGGAPSPAPQNVPVSGGRRTRSQCLPGGPKDCQSPLPVPRTAPAVSLAVGTGRSAPIRWCSLLAHKAGERKGCGCQVRCWKEGSPSMPGALLASAGEARASPSTPLCPTPNPGYRTGRWTDLMPRSSTVVPASRDPAEIRSALDNSGGFLGWEMRPTMAPPASVNPKFCLWSVEGPPGVSTGAHM